MTESLPDLPEYPLHGRYALAWKWTPSGVDRLLDAGCAWGYGTRHFTAKSREVVGLEPDPTSAAVFRARYPQIELCESATEDMPLESDSVDVILALDTFEHVRDEQRTLAGSGGSPILRSLAGAGLLDPVRPAGVQHRDPRREGRMSRLAQQAGPRASSMPHCPSMPGALTS